MKHLKANLPTAEQQAYYDSAEFAERRAEIESIYPELNNQHFVDAENNAEHCIDQGSDASPENWLSIYAASLDAYANEI